MFDPCLLSYPSQISIHPCYVCNTNQMFTSKTDIEAAFRLKFSLITFFSPSNSCESMNHPTKNYRTIPCPSFPTVHTTAQVSYFGIVAKPLLRKCVSLVLRVAHNCHLLECFSCTFHVCVMSRVFNIIYSNIWDGFVLNKKGHFLTFNWFGGFIIN